MTSFTHVMPRGYAAFAQEPLVISSTAIGPTPGTIAATAGNAKAAFITVEAQPVRFSIVGTPTAAVGHLLAAGDTLLIEGESSVSKLLLIKSGATDSAATITYLR